MSGYILLKFKTLSLGSLKVWINKLPTQKFKFSSSAHGQKKSKTWSPTTKMTYKRDLTLEMRSLHLYGSRIVTVWINSSKIRVNYTNFCTKCSWTFSLKPLCLKKLVYPFLYVKNRIKRIIFRICSQNYLFWYRNVFKNHLWLSASVQKDYSNILEH